MCIRDSPEVARLPEIHMNLGPDYEERVLPSIGNEVLKATVAQFNADQLLTMRDEVSRRVSFALRKRAEDFGIVLEDVALTHLSFGMEYSRAIEAKQVSQQDAERSKFVVLRSEQEREAAVIRAEGEWHSRAAGDGRRYAEVRDLRHRGELDDRPDRREAADQHPGAAAAVRPPLLPRLLGALAAGQPGAVSC